MVRFFQAQLETTPSVNDIPNRELAIARVHNLLTISVTLSNVADALTTQVPALHPLA